MTLSQAIEKVGNDNVSFQLLDSSAAGAQKTKHGTKFAFFTGECGPEYLLGNSEKVCVILWMPRKAWIDALESEKDEPPRQPET